MAEKSLSEIVEECNQMSDEELSEPSLESENAYAHEADYEPTEEEQDAMESILSRDL
jgi:hypothetical protein